MNVCTEFHGSPFNNCEDILLKTTNVMLILQTKLGCFEEPVDGAQTPRKYMDGLIGKKHLSSLA